MRHIFQPNVTISKVDNERVPSKVEAVADVSFCLGNFCFENGKKHVGIL